MPFVSVCPEADLGEGAVKDAASARRATVANTTSTPRMSRSRQDRASDGATQLEPTTTKPVGDTPPLEAHVAAWVSEHPLAPCEVDCALAVMLKILDGKCKMRESEKRVMRALYACVRHLPGERLTHDLRALVAHADGHDDGALREQIYAKRVLAETRISRPVMKRFKARIRAEGLFEAPSGSALDEEVA